MNTYSLKSPTITPRNKLFEFPAFVFLNFSAVQTQTLSQLKSRYENYRHLPLVVWHRHPGWGKRDIYPLILPTSKLTITLDYPPQTFETPHFTTQIKGLDVLVYYTSLFLVRN